MSPTFSRLAICCSAVLVTAIAASVHGAEIVTLLGVSHHGEVILCNEQSLSWRNASTLQTLSTNEIETVTLYTPKLLSHNLLRVMLRDGTVLVVTDYNSDQTLFPTDSIAAIHVNTSERFDTAWETACINSNAITDRLLVIQGDAVDHYEGVIVAANISTNSKQQSRVLFQVGGVDGETLAIPVTKLVGLIYAVPANTQVVTAIAPSHGTITLRDGSNIKAARWRQDGATGEWKITTTGGLSLTRQPNDVATIRFTPPSRTPLVSLTPEQAQRPPIAAWSDAAVPARTELVYRLGSRHTRLTGRVSCAASAVADTPFGAARLAISICSEGSEGKLLGEWLVRACEPSVPLDLDVTGVDQLKVIVDFPEGLITPGGVLNLYSLWLTLPQSPPLLCIALTPASH